MDNQKNTTPEITQKSGENLPVYTAIAMGSNICILLNSSNFRTFRSWTAARKALGRFRLINAASFAPCVSTTIEGDLP